MYFNNKKLVCLTENNYTLYELCKTYDKINALIYHHPGLAADGQNISGT
jgi:hypothetical protein